MTFNELNDFFNTPRHRESQAHTAKIKRECAEIQVDREARLIAEHNFDDCDGDCWICFERGRERAEDIKDAERKEGVR